MSAIRVTCLVIGVLALGLLALLICVLALSDRADERAAHLPDYDEDMQAGRDHRANIRTWADDASEWEAEMDGHLSDYLLEHEGDESA